MKTKKSLSVFGLGYVGTVTAACLANKGHSVIGVDINIDKINAINEGRSPVVERGLNSIVSSAVKNKNFFATVSGKNAVLKTDIAMVCVSTPSAESGAIDIRHLKSVITDIGRALKKRKRFYTIVIRSTILPGTTEDLLIPILEKTSGKKADRDFGICVNPEFMREGNSLEDFYSPAKTIIGIRTEKEKRLLAELFDFIKAPLIVTDIKTAEVSKYLDNTFHALKICFANEMGVISRRMGADPAKVMEIFCRDKIANISERYLRPGFAFGGSCLPKDIKAVLYKAKTEDLEIPLIESIFKSNDTHIERAFRSILMTGKKKIGILGLSFKPGTDDLRESQMVKLAELLIGKGFKLRIYDRNVALAKIIGTNKAYIDKEIPHISSVLCKSLNDVIRNSEVIVIGHNIKEFKEAAKRLRKNQVLIDLVS